MPSKKSDRKQEKSQSPSDEGAQTPIEMVQPISENEGRGAFRKLFMKLGEKVGTIKTSEPSADYISRVQEADTYKQVLCQLAESVMHVLQQNPKLVPEAESKMEFECPPSQDPLEQLSLTLASMRDNFSAHKTALEVCIDTCEKLAGLRRAYHKKGRRALHFIRTFINVDYVVLNDERQTLIKRRQQMDFAKHEYLNNPSAQKKESCDRAVAKFNEQSEVVFDALEKLQVKKEKHRLELIKVLEEMRKYHKGAALECSRVSKVKW
ncbi:unnamed protein product [Thelazia callipaeda]|uniref:BAR domain-containing protein n=1 Tax=Thelazia callipaeda TaxID=103827 RepID=A0A0N5D9I7_THECL|nr:unnamed protein product [Thelazia callipaeda]